MMSPAADSKDQFSLLLPLKTRVSLSHSAFPVPSACAALSKVAVTLERVGQHHRPGLDSWHLALPPTSCEVSGKALPSILGFPICAMGIRGLPVGLAWEAKARGSTLQTLSVGSIF